MPSSLAVSQIPSITRENADSTSEKGVKLGASIILRLRQA